MVHVWGFQEMLTVTSQTLSEEGWFFLPFADVLVPAAAKAELAAAWPQPQARLLNQASMHYIPYVSLSLQWSGAPSLDGTVLQWQSKALQSSLPGEDLPSACPGVSGTWATARKQEHASLLPWLWPNPLCGSALESRTASACSCGHVSMKPFANDALRDWGDSPCLLHGLPASQLRPHCFPSWAAKAARFRSII